VNKILLIGRLTKDTELRYSQSVSAQSGEQLAICRFNLAVDRRGKDKGADFPSCIAFGKNAENINKFFKKGNKIVIEGRIQTGNYTDKNGNKVYTTDVIVESWEFVESGNKEETPAPAASDDGFMNIPDGIDELPFN